MCFLCAFFCKCWLFVETWTATVSQLSLFSSTTSLVGSLLSALWRVSCSLFCRTWRGLSFYPAKPKLRSMRGEPEVHKRDYLHLGCLRPSVPPDFTSGFGIYRFSPGWKAEISLLRTTSWRSGARWFTAPRLGWRRAATAPCSTPLTSSLGNTTRPTSPWGRTQVGLGLLLMCVNDMCGVKKISFVWSICSPYKSCEALWDELEFTVRKLLRICGHLEISKMFYFI